MRTRTYYSGPDAVVTDERFIWLTAPAKAFAVPELHNVGLICTKGGRLGRYTVLAAGAAMIMAAATWTAMNHPPAYLFGFLGITVPSLVAAVSWRTRPRTWHIHAIYRGREVVIYSSPDARVFNQVARALRRSMEATHSPARRYGLAAA
jgi:hypothetical protein